MRTSIFPVPSSKGFTLVELMIVIVIVAILAAIAVPGYTNQIRKSRRTEARNALLDAAAREERFYATNNAYSTASSDLGYGAAWPTSVGSGYYSLGAACTSGAPCTAYTLTATAISTQVKDTSCTTLTLTSVGVQGSTGTATAATCWN
jgi:type IV pilus assembly protein PilE